MKIFLKVIKGIITAFLVVVLVIVAFQKFTHNKVAVGNLYVFQIVSESMLPEYRIGDIIVVQKTKIDNLKVGDDVTYLGSAKNFDGLTITHRIIDIRVDEEGKRYFTTKGMSNYIEDPEISEDSIYGKVVYHTVVFSFVGRLMTNIVIYYLLFISVGVSFSYEFISTYLMKKKDEDDVEEETSNDSVDIQVEEITEAPEEKVEETTENSGETTEEDVSENSFSLNKLVADTNMEEEDVDTSLDEENDSEEEFEDGDETEDGGTKK